MTDSRKKVLIVDDEENIRSSLSLLLKNNFEVKTAVDGNEALSLVKEDAPDLILLDVMMPNLDGIDTLKQLRDSNSNIPVIMLTAANTVRTAVQAMKCGAVDYLNKPFDVEELTTLIINTLDQQPTTAVAEVVSAKKHVAEIEADFGQMVGRSENMQAVFRQIEQIADKDTTLLITGESGTGKELLAKRVHELSQRKDGPFIAINCAAIPETLIESELFGHEKGAFTNAIEKRIGHFELAHGGTLFLDEIGELSQTVQVKMLRFLQEQEFYRVGRSKPVRVDVRVIAATNKNLEDLIKEKKFRQDLFYRINVINIKIPALKDRYDDIPHLIDHFVKKYSKVYGDRVIDFDESAMKFMIEYDWPGNVRELENVVESLMALAPADTVTEEMLPPKIKSRRHSQPLKLTVFDSDLNFEEAERRFETDMILKALKRTNFVQTRAAELLGISRRILKYKMDKLGISDKPDASESEASQSGPQKQQAAE
ncbi:MAG: sigma-54-dependent Fis family transcriptional regulator [Candidatus Dadabacteria bacterium]|nr:MAG: sigma-54-dependent Fis family transcriptional regulator [Candidatus Dadabacteria bacterium]